jgi:hypothetical protein
LKSELKKGGSEMVQFFIETADAHRWPQMKGGAEMVLVQKSSPCRVVQEWFSFQRAGGRIFDFREDGLKMVQFFLFSDDEHLLSWA